MPASPPRESSRSPLVLLLPLMGPLSTSKVKEKDEEEKEMEVMKVKVEAWRRRRMAERVFPTLF